MNIRCSYGGGFSASLELCKQHYPLLSRGWTEVFLPPSAVFAIRLILWGLESTHRISGLMALLQDVTSLRNSLPQLLVSLVASFYRSEMLHLWKKVRSTCGWQLPGITIYESVSYTPPKCLGCCSVADGAVADPVLLNFTVVSCRLVYLWLGSTAVLYFED